MTSKLFCPICFHPGTHAHVNDPLDMDEQPHTLFVDDDQAAAQVQLDMFTSAGSVADLPIFSGTAPRQVVTPFVERESDLKQIPLM